MNRKEQKRNWSQERRSCMDGGVRTSWRVRLCAAVLLCATTAMGLPAQTFRTLVTFDSTDGEYPQAPLVQGTDGNLYGTTFFGGSNGGGTIFKVSPTGVLTTLHNFCSQSGCADGADPQGGLLQASDGDLYGTANGGILGDGVVFKITTGGAFTLLHSFGPADGGYPMAALVQGADGDFYGTSGGGLDSLGTVFRVTRDGEWATLHKFVDSDGGGPIGGLVQGADGNFYGTTNYYGGGSNGTVFKITSRGEFTTLHTFNGDDGGFPDSALFQANDGKFYGTTSAGGANDLCVDGGCGTVFEMTPSGTLTTLYNFCSQPDCVDGSTPDSALVQAADGNLYATTDSGGAQGAGTIFKITPSGSLTTLYSFCSQRNCAAGADPRAGLVQDTNGIFYGTTFYGGANDDGTVFALTMGLGPFVEVLPTSGKAGAVVKILGTNLTSATGVTFNGVAAVFRVVSSSLITAVVPQGAATGNVQVTTPHGTLSSNVPFRVRP